MKPWFPLLGIALVGAWGALIQSVVGKIKRPQPPKWPYAQNPNLSLELADSPAFVREILGAPESEDGLKNRRLGVRLQKLDFVLIPLYTAFFIVAAAVRAGWAASAPVIFAVGLTAVFDYLEDWRILALLRSDAASPPKPFGQLKWLLYFATLGAEGALFLGGTGPWTARRLAGAVLGILLISNAIGGAISSVKGSFTGIFSATKLSMFLLPWLAAAPLIAAASFSWRTVAVYAVLMRIPVLTAMVLLLLPLIAFFTPARSLLRGLFDLTPWSVFVVALASLAAAGASASAANIILADGRLRFGADPVPVLTGNQWIMVMAVISLPIIIGSVVFSTIQKHGFVQSLLGAVGGSSLALAISRFFVAWEPGLKAARIMGPDVLDRWGATGLFKGYLPEGSQNPWPDHLSTVAAFLLTLLVYAIVGLYGYLKLGRERTVPALGSALMLLTMLTWLLSGAAFFFDLWRIPILLIVVIAGTLTAQSARSDHYYKLLQVPPPPPAPSPAEAVQSPQLIATPSPRVIVVAANGGGIQAAAWTAKVLYELHQYCGERFAHSLRLISSVSGGSVGTAFYVHWLVNPKTSKTPPEAAAQSSLDEVAWGLGWTDFLRALFPWVFGFLIGRGRALERAWCLNAVRNRSEVADLDKPLSGWNDHVRRGDIPAVVMNATVAETGERLLLSTTRMKRGLTGTARVDADDLHRINGSQFDVSVASAARLSASFPYVTPASRSNGPGPQPHVVDGGYYDNYGMATLVEWLDQALADPRNHIFHNVLVIQIHGAPVAKDLDDKRYSKTRGWFYQAIAPLTTLAAVRSAGQVAHNEIELDLLKQKYAAKGVSIETVPFEFSNPNAPLSWHLTKTERDAIKIDWDEKMSSCRDKVCRFLSQSAHA